MRTNMFHGFIVDQFRPCQAVGSKSQVIHISGSLFLMGQIINSRKFKMLEMWASLGQTI